MSHPLRPLGVTLGPNLWSALWHSQSERGPNRSFGMDKSHPEFERFDNATRKAVVWDASMLFIQLIAGDGTIDQFMLDTMMQWYYCCFKKKGSLNLTEHVTFCCPFSSYYHSHQFGSFGIVQCGAMAYGSLLGPPTQPRLRCCATFEPLRVRRQCRALSPTQRKDIQR